MSPGRLSPMVVRARCRHHDAYGVRCEARIPEGAKYCEPHARGGARSAEKLARDRRAIEKWERERVERERALAAYRRRLDPGPLPLD